MTPNYPSNYAPTSYLSYRQARLERSLTRLTTHPAVNPNGPHSSYSPPPHTIYIPPSQHQPHQLPPAIFQALFDDLVRRELGVDPNTTPPSRKRALIDVHLTAARAVASKPSLSDPHFIRSLSTGYPPHVLTDKPLVEKVAPKTVTSLRASPAERIHRAIQEARAEREKLESQRQPVDNAKEEGLNPANDDANTGAPQRQSARRRSSQHAEEHPDREVPRDDEHVNPTDQSLQMATLASDAAMSRKTRSSSRRLSRTIGNSNPSECCFCPDPSLFDGKEIESELIGPFVNRRGQAKLFVHFDCACWAPQVFTDVQTGQLRHVFDEYCRGRKLKCSECGGRGATIGCYVQKCKNVFHLRCLTKSGARKVHKYLVAFCANHAHLSEEKSYQILLEAATIADVAAAHRRQDSTFGLDAPHSRYTQLRRRETEVIFSRKLGICSHTGAFETAKVVFSHRRKRALSKMDRLSASDRPRLLLVSAFDIASGRLAYMSVAGKDESGTMTAVEARAALASRETSGLLLLRNLRKAPMWTKDQITVVQKSDDDVSKAGVAVSETTSELMVKKPTTPLPGASVSQEGDPIGKDAVKNANLGSGLPVEASEISDVISLRRSARRRVNISSSDNENPATFQNLKVQKAQSVALPTMKKARVSFAPVSSVPIKQGQQGRLFDDSTNTATEEQGQPPKKRAQEIGIDATLTKKQRVTVLLAQESTIVAGEVRSARRGLVGKVKSAWETFLEEQLPKERLLRPDDNEAAAMRNMARLWSLLSPESRENYQERARQAVYGPVSARNVPDTPGASKVLTTTKSDFPDKEKKLAALAACLSESNDPGLFAGSVGLTALGGEDVEATEIKKDSPERRQPSVALPRKGRREKSSGSLAHYDLVAVDWDDLLPTSLNQDDRGVSDRKDGQNETEAASQVRVAPIRSKKLD